MKNIYIILLFIFSTSIFAQFNYQWANSVGTSGAEFGKAIATDASGNVYVTGVFTGTCNFAASSSAPVNLTSKGGKDVFFAKYDPAGQLIYANQIGGTDDESPYDIYVDANAIYIVGIFKGTCDFDPSANTANITFNGGGTDGDGFVAKYDLTGNYQWTFKLGSTANDRALAITGDKNGDLLVSGFISNTVDFDPSSGTANLTAQSNTYNSFFAKYTSTGNYVFAKLLVGDYNEANDIKTDSNGDIFLLGDWSETVDVDPSGSTVNITTNSQLNFNAYLVKYSSTGNYIWHKTTSGNGINMGTQLAINASNIYIGGVFTVTCDFDPSLSTANLTSAGGSDLFFAKYDLNGNYVLAYGIGGPTNDFLNGLALNSASEIFITGKFTGTNVNFSPAGIGPATALLTGNNTGYVAQYTTTGNFIAAHSIGSGVSDGKGIHVAHSAVYLTGLFQSTVDFDFSTSGTANLTSNGGDDVFVAKYNTSGSTAISEVVNNNFIVYPNPSTNGLFNTSAQGVIEIYNSLGQLIYSAMNNSSDQFLIDLNKNKSGVYFMVVTNNNTVIQTKIIKQ